MKNLKLVLVLLLSVGTVYASSTETPEGINIRYNGRAYIFIEGSVEFSVFADGQFDFTYFGKQNNTSVFVNTPGVFVSFNAGHNYEAYLQYDDYGAIIQIEDVPVYYDVYGRIIQAGEVQISYIDRAISRVGGLQIYYNRYGDYDHCVGYINSYNRFYTYRPRHRYYIRPIYTNCIVLDIPYRRHYTPIRHSYYVHLRYYNNRTNNTYANGRREFISPGSRIHYRNGRTALNTKYKRGRKNTMVTSHGAKTRVTRATNTNRVRNSRTYQNNTSTLRVTNTKRPRQRVSNTRVVSNSSRNRTAMERVIARTVTTTPKLKRKKSIRNVITTPKRNTVAQSTSRKTTGRKITSRKRRL